LNKILLDTSYLLPIFGIDVDIRGLKENFSDVLRKFEVYYNPISLIEAKFIILRLLKDGIDLLKDYRIGLNCILTEETLKPTPFTNSEIEEIADKLLIEKGINDYFDRMIYATAVTLKLILITEDRKLLDLANSYDLKPPNAYSWKDIQSILSQL